MSAATLTVEGFGRQLIETGDLDPIYIGLVGAGFPRPQLYRWLVAYWCYYDAGVSSYLSEREGDGFWDAMLLAARNLTPSPLNDRWPRGTERRHFRGALALNSVGSLLERYPGEPERMVDYIAGGDDGPAACEPFKSIYDRAKSHVGFGPWIAFKVADMLDRCAGIPVQFDEAAVFMFDDPAKAVDVLWRLRVGPTEPTTSPDGHTLKPVSADKRRTQVVAALAKEFAALRAPPLGDRPINIQEIETILCKWKSHNNGHYPVGKDTRELRHTLALWAPVSPAAAAMLEASPT